MYKILFEFLVFVLLKVLLAFPTTWLLCYLCDNIFSTDLMDNYWYVFTTLTILRPLLMGQFCNFKMDKGER